MTLWWWCDDELLWLIFYISLLCWWHSWWWCLWWWMMILFWYHSMILVVLLLMLIAFVTLFCIVVVIVILYDVLLLLLYYSDDISMLFDICWWHRICYDWRLTRCRLCHFVTWRCVMVRCCSSSGYWLWYLVYSDGNFRILLMNILFWYMLSDDRALMVGTIPLMMCSVVVITGIDVLLLPITCCSYAITVARYDVPLFCLFCILVISLI